MIHEPHVTETLGILHETVQHRYGADGEHPLAYHNDAHARDVSGAAQAIGERAGFGPHSLAILAIAGMGHDIVQLQEYGTNEARSAAETVAIMEEVGGFKSRDSRLVRECIMGTVVRFSGDGRIKQAAGDSKFARVVADADLANLGKPPAAYFPTLRSLFEEWHPGEAYESEAGHAFDAGTIKLLKTHRFYTPAATALFPHQSENLRILREQQLQNAQF